MEKILIINTGGTFNKVYNPLNGELEIPLNNNAVNAILENSLRLNKKPKVKGIIYKDSLDIDKNDRKILLNTINESKESKIIVVHGTDTMDKSATLISKHIQGKQIIFTGSMVPYSINPIEATANIMQAYGFLQGNKKEGVFISMNGFVKLHNKLKKNKKIGVFQCQ